MPKKLTETLKKEILEGFRLGRTLTSLAKEYGCTPTTITRTVKSFLTDVEYLQLKARKGKEKLFKNSKNNNRSNSNVKNSLSIPSVDISSKDYPNENSFLTEEGLQINSQNEDFISSSNDDSNVFTELIPLTSETSWDKQKEVACIPLNDQSLPEIVYMLVDKKVELESKPLKDFSDWSFLSEQDKERLAILLFSNQRDAKRNCSKTQRVLKVPDSKVFLISSSYLLSKGITRLIIDDSLIALDNNY